MVPLVPVIGLPHATVSGSNDLDVTANDRWTLTRQERALVRKHLRFYRGLDEGRVKPRTPAQEHFVAVCRAQDVAQTPHERAYFKFRAGEMAQAKVRPWRKEAHGIPEHPEGWPVNEFGSRAEFARDRASWKRNGR